MENNDLGLHTSLNEKDWSKLLNQLNVTLHLSQESVFQKLAILYSELLDENVSSLQAVYFFYAQLAALGFFFPAQIGAGWRTCFLLIFCHAIRCAFRHQAKK